MYLLKPDKALGLVRTRWSPSARPQSRMGSAHRSRVGPNPAIDAQVCHERPGHGRFPEFPGFANLDPRTGRFLLWSRPAICIRLAAKNRVSSNLSPHDVSVDKHIVFTT